MRRDDLKDSGEAQRWIGARVERVEDEPLLTGGGRYVDDLSPQGCVHVVFFRSPVAHARLTDLRTAGAAAAPGVLAVFTASDTGALGPLPVNELGREIHVPPRHAFAGDRVLSAGEPVAAIVAATLPEAIDALELVEADFEPLEPVHDGPRAAVGTPLFEGFPGNEAFRVRYHVGQIPTGATADTVVSVKVAQPRVAANPLEPRAALAAWNADLGSLTVWLSTQTPHRAHADFCELLGLEAEKVRVVAPHVGGAFGAKASIYHEDLLVAWIAMRLARPVKWIATRGEDLLSATHGRGAVLEGELSLRRDGTLLGLRADLEFPLGSWLPYSAFVPAQNAARILPGPYRVPSVEIEARGRLSNCAAVGIYRGAGRPEAAMLMERLMDEGARAIGMDPAELRARNLLPADAFPYATPTGQVLDSGDYPRVLALALERSGYPALRAEQRRRRTLGEVFGIGIAFYVEPCGQGWESARVRIERDGSVRAASGASPQGQGQATAFAQIVADRIGVPLEQVQLLQGDTEHTPAGVGALASRSTAIGGSALARAADAAAERLREGAPLPIEESVVYTAPGEAWSCGCCVASVSIDADTGALQVESFTWVDDAGVVINPLLVEGQLVGGYAQGLGQALMERIVYDDQGQLLTGSLLDYAVPRAGDVPPLTIAKIATPSPANALGAKGAGESGCIGVPSAIVNAAVDALAPLGVRHLDVPLTSENLWRAMTLNINHGRDQP